jgi:hypothetical protein
MALVTRIMNHECNVLIDNEVLVMFFGFDATQETWQTFAIDLAKFIGET